MSHVTQGGKGKGLAPPAAPRNTGPNSKLRTTPPKDLPLNTGGERGGGDPGIGWCRRGCLVVSTLVVGCGWVVFRLPLVSFRCACRSSGMCPCLLRCQALRDVSQLQRFQLCTRVLMIV
jgi:hypothetical protein